MIIDSIQMNILFFLFAGTFASPLFLFIIVCAFASPFFLFFSLLSFLNALKKNRDENSDSGFVPFEPKCGFTYSVLNIIDALVHKLI